MAGTGAGPVGRGRTALWPLAAVLLAVLVGVIVAVLVFDGSPATGSPGPAADRQAVTERLVNEGYLPREMLD
jgi:hypothetical protein